MGRLNGPDLDAALADPDAAVQRRAAQVSARRPEIPLAGRLVELLAGDPMVAEMAAWALGERETSAVAAPGSVLDALIRMAGDHPDPLCREAAVAALGAIGDQRGLPAILAATGDRPAVRRRAVLALAPYDGPEVDAALERARHDRDWQVRQAAEDLTSRP
jgi:HEAT repeat protein